MSHRAARRVHRATAFISVTGILFFLFFQLAKREPFRSANPFGQDPYDLVGSFAVQIALLIGVLTCARAAGSYAGHQAAADPSGQSARAGRHRDRPPC